MKTMKNDNDFRTIEFGEKRKSVRLKTNLRGDQPEYNGIIVIRLNEKYANLEGDEFKAFCKKNGLGAILKFLETLSDVSVTRVIKTKMLEKLSSLEKRAKQSETRPLRSLSTYWKFDFSRKIQIIEESLKIINELYGVDYAYLEHTPSLPLITDSDDPLATDQDYLGPAPVGIDARWAWTQPNCEGAGVGVIDCEWGWVNTHEDLIGKAPTVIHNDNCFGSGGSFDSGWYNHGTAVLGEIIGTDNTLGVVGIAPSVDYVKMSSFYDAATDNHADSSEAIIAAALEMNPGDVMLLEIQKGFKPTEIDDTDFDAIRLATAVGIIVVEAAGNGNTDLDAWVSGAGQRRLNRNHADFQDSGAILVGACVSTMVAGAHEKWLSSNYGSRIDCHGYGENIVSTGYGDLSGTNDLNNYTEDFGGTSGASPMIVGCALLLQGKYKAESGSMLSPSQMRMLLSNPLTGTPQGTTVAGNIGFMPNLRAIIEDTLELVADIYLRDDVGDTGTVPSAGAISASPDIIVLPSEIVDPTLSFGEGSGTENSNSLGTTVEAGQDNFVYVRMQNRGMVDATDVKATIFWSPPATLITPDMWNLIGTTDPVNVAVGDTLVVSNKLVWAKTDIPATGHYCFVGILDSPQDSAPPIPPVVGFDWANFQNFIRNNNNVTWRNFNVENNLPDVPSAFVNFPFMISNAPDKRRRFDIQIFQKLPKDGELWLEIPLKFMPLFRDIEFLEAKIDKKKEKASIRLPRHKNMQFNNVLLPIKARIACNFVLRGSKLYQKGTHYFGVRQLFEKFEVGRITWALKPKKG
jgi:serine protease